MNDLPRPRPPYLHRTVTRHGAVAWYVWRGKGHPKIRVRGDYSSAEFMASYQAAVNGEAAPKKPGAKNGTLEWLIRQYQQSMAWNPGLSATTRKKRDAIFRRVIEKGGEAPASAITQQHIAQTRDKMRATPFQAIQFLKAMRGLFAWAVEAQHVQTNPTTEIKTKTPKTDGHHVWTDDEVCQFEARWPIGTRERLALAVLLYTGLRLSDAIRLGRQHVKNGVATLRADKNNKSLSLPILPDLARIIEASQTGDLAFFARKDGAKMSESGAGKFFRVACDAAGVPGSAHGLRKAGATRAAENGATEKQMEALFCWRSGSKMAGLYTRTADRARLSQEAAHLLARNENGTSIFSPDQPVGKPDRKTKQKQS